MSISFKTENSKCTRNCFHGNDARWRNLPKRPGVKAEGLVSKQKAWKISSHKQEEYGIPFHAFLLLNFFGNLLLAIAFSYLKEIIFLPLLFCKGCMRFINKHTLRQESNTASTVNYFSPAEKQSCCGRNITASYQRVLYPRRGRRRAP